MSYKTTKEQFTKIAPKVKSATAWTESLNWVLSKWDIDTEDRVKMFLAQTSHESAGFTALSENLNYSEKALKSVFGKYFGQNKASAKDYARRPMEIANLVYANRMGNGDEASGDGWKYRGRGIIQLTGKNNYSQFAKDTDMSLENALVFASSMRGCIETAGWYWQKNNLNRFADNKDVKGITKAINGGYNGLEHRQELWDGLQS